MQALGKRAISRLNRDGSNHQQSLDTCVFGGVNNDTAAQVALLLLRFGARDVAEPGAVALYFSSAGYFKTLLGAGVGLHFRHNKNDVC